MKIDIKNAREKRGISQRELASRTGVARSIIRMLENGEKDYISTKKLEKIAEVLGVSVYDIWH